tara:strand:- start:431 stop:1105 length:675 start_codon:yes stop_codon:yes gene_type:complete
MDDIDRSTALINNRVLKYDAASKKFVGTTAAGGQSLDEVLDIGNSTTKGIVVGVVTASQFSGNITGDASINVTGIITAQRIFSAVHGEFTGGSVLAENIVGTALSISGISTFTGQTNHSTISASGTVTATDFNSTSDVKLKKNIKQIEDPISKIMTIEGVSFNWKSDNRPSLGVIADQLENTLPELVSDDDPKTVNYNGLVGLLIECVKNQQQQIDELKDQLNN